MKVFISGAIENEPDYVNKFKAAEESIRAAGHIPVNPVLPEGLGTKEDYLRVCFAMLDMCDAIYVIPGVYHSNGSTSEQIYASLTCKKVLVQKDGKWSMTQSTVSYKQHATKVERIKRYIRSMPVLEHLPQELDAVTDEPVPPEIKACDIEMERRRECE